MAFIVAHFSDSRHKHLRRHRIGLQGSYRNSAIQANKDVLAVFPHIRVDPVGCFTS